MLTDRRGYGALGFVLLFLFLLIMWPFVFAPMFNLAGENALTSGATGLEAFLWTNLNLWFALVLIVVAIIYFRFSGGGA